MRQKLLLAASLLLPGLLYLPALRYQLVFDDHLLLEGNQRLTAWSYVPGFFGAHLFANIPDAHATYFRPLSLLAFRLTYAVLGPPRAIWHLSSILAHVAAMACLYLLFRRLTGDFKGSLLAAGLFAIAPVHAEAVAWVSGLGDLLLTCFLALSVYFYAGRKGPISILSLVFATLAVFTKETGVVIPALILAYEWTHSDGKRAVVSAAPYVLPVMLYLVIRMHALGGLSSGSVPAMSVGAMLLTWPQVIAAYLRHLFWPVHLSPFYQEHIGDAIGPLLLFASAAAGTVWLARKRSASVRFGVAWFAITFAPALAIIRYTSAGDFVHDRYLYLPSVGLALIAATCFRQIRFTVPRAALACVFAGLLCWGTAVNMRIWRNDLTLFTRAVEVAPRNPIALENLAVSYLEANRPAEAVPLLQRFVELRPDVAVGFYDLGLCYQQMGDSEQAARYFSQASRMGGR